MNALIIVIIAGILFFWGYRFYARKLESLWQIDPKRSTPAFSKYDSVDFIPAKNWFILFGHHFASIAGAGPIIGPVIAVMLWGWLPAIFWVILGTIFIGGVHDFSSLITSVRQEGSSVAEISQKVISYRAKLIFSLFVWLALILVIAVFVYLCADTFVKEPKIVLPSLGLIFVAMLVGFLIYNLKQNFILVTILGLLGLINLIQAGNFFPIKGSLNFWLLILLVYCYFASILPVNILLQPRDYLCSFLLIFGMGIGYLGLFLSRPNLISPAYHHWVSSEGYLWPILFVTIACGAISGFHSLISSGTTSKQLANERHAKRIGYGAMVAEGLVAILAIISAAVLFTPKDNLANVLKTIGPIGIYAKGYGLITKLILGNYGTFLAVTILNAFILTTLDTATRISRYILEELLSIKNRYFSTILVIGLALVLAMGGRWQRIWPAFGASNQLVASLTLFVVSCWLLSKDKSFRITLWPGIFMLITTTTALIFQAKKYFLQKDILLFIIAVILIILAGFMVSEIIPVLMRKKK